jgi:hypothetical protein
MAAESRYANIVRAVRQLIGDSDSIVTAEAMYYSVQAALARYSSVFERVIAQTLKLSFAGLWAQPLKNWSGDQLCEIAYLHWPAASTVPTTVTENKILNYWYWFDGYYSSGAYELCYVDLQVEGSTLPAAEDYILVAGICQHRILGMEYQNYGAGDASTYSTVPKAHEHIISLGAAAYALRYREAGPQLLLEDPLGESYYSTYHIGVMADMSDRYMRDFEQELYKLNAKRFHRPIWSPTERERMQRLDGKI